MRRAARGFGLAILLLAVAVLAGTLVPRPLWPDGDRSGPTRRILVLENPIHTDIAIPLDARTQARFAFLEDAGVPIGDPDARWLIFGWGGRAFYLETPTWSDLKPGPVFKALTIDRSVMHVDIAGDISESNAAVTAFKIDEEGFDRLLAFVARSFAREKDRPVLIIGASYGPNDRFYEALGSFNALVGCNTWTARALREAGLRTGWWGPLPFNLLTSLALYNPRPLE